MMHHLLKRQLSRCLFTLSLIVTLPCWANNLAAGDNYYQQQQYDLATKEYLSAAELGVPGAYYQLGKIYFLGLGTKTDALKALIWFSLAAEYDFKDSAELAKIFLTKVPNDQQTRALDLIQKFKESLAQKSIDAQYYPELQVNNLDQKIYFGDQTEFDQPSTDNNAQLLDFDLDLTEFDDLTITAVSYDENDMPMDSVSFDSFLNTSYFLIADYDIAPDGSIRNIMPVHAIGMTENAIEALTMHTLPKPNVDAKGTYFINRSYLGQARFNKFRARKDDGLFYAKIKGFAAKSAMSNSPKDIYQQGMLKMLFPWLEQEEGDVDNLLKSAAQQGHALAQFEYGLKLYRQQEDPKQAIYWITQATKQGVSQAEYRLGRILLDSPWVINDEKKALFWLDKALKQQHVFAKLKSTEIKLLTKDETLQDITGAGIYLAELAEQQAQNPQYLYLQAMHHYKMQARELAKAVEYIREAIDLGNDYHWDTAPWQQQLSNWTTGGRVTIKEL